ncbi:MAG: N-acetylmuramoyl-L-alanine amidase [Muribaculaceae bacterium]|nr:N-acetylmuramoyl-L-alanine amidase [Muribaculaceae bacterium]
MKVLIDNGHGSNTPGKRSPDGRVREWKWTREVADKVVAKLRAAGIDAARVVTEEADVSLTERVKRINAVCKERGSKNVLLVSIHINAAGDGSKWMNACGCSAWVSKNASLTSKAVAVMFTEAYKTHGMSGNRSVPACGYNTWSWTPNDIYILKASNCPAVLTENWFMDNQADCNTLASERGKEQAADVHVECIVKAVRNLFDMV